MPKAAIREYKEATHGICRGHRDIVAQVAPVAAITTLSDHNALTRPLVGYQGARGRQTKGKLGRGSRICFIAPHFRGRVPV